MLYTVGDPMSPMVVYPGAVVTVTSHFSHAFELENPYERRPVVGCVEVLRIEGGRVIARRAEAPTS
jgi:hypothetical protein